MGFSEKSLTTSDTHIKGVTGHSLTVLGQLHTVVRSLHGNNKAKIQLIITSGGPAVLG